MFINKHVLSSFGPVYVLRSVEISEFNAWDQTDVISVNTFIKQNELKEKLSAL